MVTPFLPKRKERGGGIVKVMIGLGNPGKQYDRTRHNVGFDVVDLLSERWDIPVTKEKYKGLFGMGHIHGEKVILFKPQTYMNLSGEAVRPLVDFYNISPSDIVVMYDDMDLSIGSIRLRQKGGAGGHNGMKSMVEQLGTKEFNRLRIGIGKPEAGTSIVNYVLGKFPPDDQEAIEQAKKQAADACEAWLEKPFVDVMSTFNQN